MMMRIFNLLAGVMVFVAGFALYRMKCETQQLQNRVDELNRQIADDQSETKVLDAEWAYLSNPQRLQRLASRYLDLQPAGPKQMLQTVANIQPRADDENKDLRVVDYEPALPVGRHVAAVKVAVTERPVERHMREKPAERQAKLVPPLTRRPFNPLTDHIRLVSSDGEQRP